MTAVYRLDAPAPAIARRFAASAGEDPWHFIPDLPSVDEQVVISLRAGAIEEFDLAEEQSRAHHPAAGRDTFARFEYGVLRRIALEHPELSEAVWGMLDKVERA